MFYTLHYVSPSVTSLIATLLTYQLYPLSFSFLPTTVIPHQTLSLNLTSEYSQHPFQIWGPKYTFQLGWESLGLPQGPELTPRKDRTYEPPGADTGFHQHLCLPHLLGPSMNFNTLLRKVNITLQRVLALDQKT
jgi:hypothetical protein